MAGEIKRQMRDESEAQVACAAQAVSRQPENSILYSLLEMVQHGLDANSRRAWARTCKTGFRQVLTHAPNAKLTLRNADDSQDIADSMLWAVKARAGTSELCTTLATTLDPASFLQHPLINSLLSGQHEVRITGLDLPLLDSAIVQALSSFPHLTTLTMADINTPLPAPGQLPATLQHLSLHSATVASLRHITPLTPQLTSLHVSAGTPRPTYNALCPVLQAATQLTALRLYDMDEGSLGAGPHAKLKSYTSQLTSLSLGWSAHDRISPISFNNVLSTWSHVAHLELEDRLFNGDLVRSLLKHAPNLRSLTVQVSRFMGDSFVDSLFIDSIFMDNPFVDNSFDAALVWQLKQLTLLVTDLDINLAGGLLRLPHSADRLRVTVVLPPDGRIVVDKVADGQRIDELLSRFDLRITSYNAALPMEGGCQQEPLETWLSVAAKVAKFADPPPLHLSVTEPLTLAGPILDSLATFDCPLHLHRATLPCAGLSNTPNLPNVRMLHLNDPPLNAALLVQLATSFPNLTDLTVLSLELTEDYSGTTWNVNQLTILGRRVPLLTLTQLPATADGQQLQVHVTYLMHMLGDTEALSKLQKRNIGVHVPCYGQCALLLDPSARAQAASTVLAATVSLLASTPQLSGVKNWDYTEALEVQTHPLLMSEPLLKFHLWGARHIECRCCPATDAAAERCRELLQAFPPSHALYISGTLQLTEGSLRCLSVFPPSDTKLHACWRVSSDTQVNILPVVEGVKSLELTGTLDDHTLRGVRHCFPQLECLVVESVNLQGDYSHDQWSVTQLQVLDEAVTREASARLPKLAPGTSSMAQG